MLFLFYGLPSLEQLFSFDEITDSEKEKKLSPYIILLTGKRHWGQGFYMVILAPDLSYFPKY